MSANQLDLAPVVSRLALTGTGVEKALEALPAITATELKSDIANVFRRLGPRDALAVSNHRQLKGVIVGVDEYIELLRLRENMLGALEAELDRQFASMQTPAAARAVEQLFRATPAELGAAAVAAATGSSPMTTDASH